MTMNNELVDKIDSLLYELCVGSGTEEDVPSTRDEIIRMVAEEKDKEIEKEVEIGLKMMNGLKQVIAELKADALSKAQACRALAQQNEKLNNFVSKAIGHNHFLSLDKFNDALDKAKTEGRKEVLEEVRKILYGCPPRWDKAVEHILGRIKEAGE